MPSGLERAHRELLPSGDSHARRSFDHSCFVHQAGLDPPLVSATVVWEHAGVWVYVRADAGTECHAHARIG